MRISRSMRAMVPAMLLAMLATTAFGLKFPKLKPTAKSSEQLRTEYITRLQGNYVVPTDVPTTGSLWTPQATMGELSTDYKARHLNDTVTIVVSVQTTAAQSGSVDSERTFSTT